MSDETPSEHQQRTPTRVEVPPRRGLVIILSGPSGVGKDTIMGELKRHTRDMRYVVTMTTRPPRPGERHGLDYYFTDMDNFIRLRDSNELLEWAFVHNNYYGVPKSQVREALAEGKDVLLRIDVQGAATIKAKIPEAVTIFLAPASMDELIERLQGRRTESADDLAIRTHNAQMEIARLTEYDYVVVNERGRLLRAVEQVQAILVAEHCRVQSRTVSL